MAKEKDEPKKTSIPYLQRKYKLSYQAAKKIYEEGTMPLEMPVEEKFYLKGNIYYTYEEFEKALIEHENLIATEKDIYEFFKDIASNICINMEIYKVTKTNAEIKSFRKDIFLASLDKFMRKI